MLQTKFRRSISVVALALCCTFGAPAKAAILFNNALDPDGFQSFWCDPCAIGHDNQGYRVWDSFTLAADSTLTSLRYLGLRTDLLTLGVNVQIAAFPYGPNLFAAHYADGSVARFDTGSKASVRIVALPDVKLSAGTYWITAHGPSEAEHHTWLAQVLANGDNSLYQFGPNPDNPIFAIQRFMDARFRLDGEVAATPLPGALVLFLTGFGFLVAFFRRGSATA